MRKKLIYSLLVIFTLIFNVVGCSNKKEIVVSENAKKDAIELDGTSNPKNELVLKGELKRLKDLDLLCWIDNENLLAVKENDNSLIFYKYNIKGDKYEELLKKDDTKTFGEAFTGGIILLKDKYGFYVYNAKTNTTEDITKLLDEKKLGIDEGLLENRSECIFIKDGLIELIVHKEMENEDYKTTYIIDYKNNSKKEFKGMAIYGLDLTNKYGYVSEGDSIFRINIENGSKDIIHIGNRRPNVIRSVLDKSSIITEVIEKDEEENFKSNFYSINFDNKEITKCEEFYYDKPLNIAKIDTNTNLVLYTAGDDKLEAEEGFIFYGMLKDNKFIVKGSLYDSKERVCSQIPVFYISPDHRKIITTGKKENDETQWYMFQLE